eukprot:5237287-Pyramimonas_sp.AAC.1
MGDWNATPQQLWDPGWPSYDRGSIVTALAAFTSTSGHGLILDFGRTSEEMAGMITLQLDLKGPWSPHIGLRGELRMDRELLQAR